ncbi:MAG: DNA polymerase III epsilon subunit family exonuclease [Planctomycetota bacterium]|jgi:DNA polymerase III epsilon subunit family exonuclease
MEKPLVVFDTETATRFGPPHLIEIGAVRIVDGEIVDHFNSLVSPEVVIETETQEIHGITDEMTRSAPSVPVVLREFFDWLGDDWLAAHDTPQDAHVLGFECTRHSIAAPHQPMLDSLAISKRLIPESPDHTLETLIQFLDLDHEELHRALSDAVACWKVLEECIERERMDPEGNPSFESLLAKSRRFTTIASSTPRHPRLPKRLRLLETSARDSAQVILHYGDKDQRPIPLPVFPRLIYKLRDRSYLEGECPNAGILKTYRIDRIHRVTPG